jgi:hypothetical protein
MYPTGSGVAALLVNLFVCLLVARYTLSIVQYTCTAKMSQGEPIGTLSIH